MHEIDTDILSKNMKQLMKTANVTQNALATKFNLEQSTISKYINCKQIPPLSFLYSFAKYFAVTIDSLCQESSATEEHSDVQTNPYPKPAEYIINVCTALATIFKSSYVKTEHIQKHEITFREIVEDGYETGRFYRDHDSLGLDPVHEYVSLYFSNYLALETKFSSTEEAEDYQMDLELSGNFHDSNSIINNFLRKLADLHDIYEKESITKESYIHSIDSNLATLIDELLHQ